MLLIRDDQDVCKIHTNVYFVHKIIWYTLASVSDSIERKSVHLGNKQIVDFVAHFPEHSLMCLHHYRTYKIMRRDVKCTVIMNEVTEDCDWLESLWLIDRRRGGRPSFAFGDTDNYRLVAEIWSHDLLMKLHWHHSTLFWYAYLYNTPSLLTVTAADWLLLNPFLPSFPECSQKRISSVILYIIYYNDGKGTSGKGLTTGPLRPVRPIGPGGPRIANWGEREREGEIERGGRRGESEREGESEPVWEREREEEREGKRGR